MLERMKAMLDTNAFNDLIKGQLPLVPARSVQYFCTNLQEAELRRTANEKLRTELLARFQTIAEEVGTQQIKQHSTPWGSPWVSPWGRGGKHYRDVLAALEREKKGDRGNSYDAVLIETCIYEKLTFVSNDKAARKVAVSFGVEALSLEAFMSRPEHEL